MRLSAIGIPQITINGAADPNNPHAVGFSYDAPNNVFNCYLDGVLLATQTGFGTPNISGNGTNAFAIGAYLVASTLSSSFSSREYRSSSSG